MEAASIKVDYGVSVEEDKKYTNKEVTISGEVVDTLSGIGEKKGGVFLKKASDNEEQWEKAVVKELENGKYEFSLKLAPQTYTGTYQIKTVNEAGAESDGTLKTPIVYQDNAAPVFDKDSISIPTDWAASALITGKVSDQGDAGIKRVAYRLEGTENWTDWKSSVWQIRNSVPPSRVSHLSILTSIRRRRSSPVNSSIKITSWSILPIFSSGRI